MEYGHKARSMRFLVTGGAGFIGSEVIRQLINNTPHTVANVDCLTYAGNLDSLKSVSDSARYHFFNQDICDENAMLEIFASYKPHVVLHLAAESHVDKSISSPNAFIKTNIMGTYNLLVASMYVYKTYDDEVKRNFRFHHVSTDEVYGSLGAVGKFLESTPYDPRSPYSSSKAASDHLVRAWHHTYGLPISISNCSNNYGQYQFPEKLIPLTILNCLRRKPIPVYGTGMNVRDWIHVTDHADAVIRLSLEGKVGETYNVGANQERNNLEIVNTLCQILDELHPQGDGSYSNLIEFVKDRAGHDFRYAIDATKLQNHLGWHAKINFIDGLRNTVQWYLNNRWWWEKLIG